MRLDVWLIIQQKIDAFIKFLEPKNVSVTGQKTNPALNPSSPSVTKLH